MCEVEGCTGIHIQNGPLNDNDNFPKVLGYWATFPNIKYILERYVVCRFFNQACIANKMRMREGLILDDDDMMIRLNA